MLGVEYRPDFSTQTEGSEEDESNEDEESSENADRKRPADTESLSASSADCLIFHDEFDKLDNSVWKHDITMSGGGNYEFQLYHNNRTNTFVKNGIFYIKPTLTDERIGKQGLMNGGVLDMWGADPGTACTGNYNYGCFRAAGGGGNILNPIQSGMVRTVNSVKFRYGKVVVRARMPKGDWLWPAIWLLPVHYQYGNWPASGEIDIVEARGNGPEYEAGGINKISSTLHWGIKTYVDDHLLLNVRFDDMFKKGKFPEWVHNLWEGSNAAPFDQEFYILMNVAVGGTAGYFPDGYGNKPWSDRSPHAVNEFYDAKDQWYPTWGSADDNSRAMAIDYIRVYRHDC
ncbi:hypothetical protein BGW41_008042 [Actinomortierella wolfii]|nr:hypothetical protein BGW41_008042 [Actinomortierella wolfii]